MLILSSFLGLWVFYCLFLYPNEDPIIKMGEGWDPNDWFNPTTLLCLSQARTLDVKHQSINQPKPGPGFHGDMLCSMT
jgi:hypothetical protein